uniref:Fn3_like domain-containing protein n=1 Tax=Caenorhabditis tropicalis TaxID=1561998 RepID=A0A1I7TVA5_9PELO
MPLKTSATVRLQSNHYTTFTDFYEKIIDKEELKVGTTLTVSYIGSHIEMKRFISFLERQENLRETIWNGRLSFTIDLASGDEKELVVTWNVSGTVFETKRHITLMVLPKGSSKDREH